MQADQRARRDAFLDEVGRRPVVMGILNVTPDSFSDGGLYLEAEAAVAHAKRMAAEGCDILDIGGESTRPGATPVPEAEERARLEQVLRSLARELPVPISIDTYKAGVAAHAVALGAIMVNDVWGLQRDPGMADAVADSEAAVVIMHNRRDKDASLDIVAEMRRFFDHSLALARRAGIPDRHIILDPGLGFGKTAQQNIAALAHLRELMDYGHPILIGASRKKLFGARLAGNPEGGLIGTIAVSLAAAAAGAAIFRVHDVAEHVAALRVFDLVRKTNA
jgi:dihydropteroate synthase